VWAAGEALERGATVDEAAAVAEALAPTIGNVFVVCTLDVLNAGEGLTVGPAARGIRVLEMRGGTMEVIDEVGTVLEAVNATAAAVVGWGTHLKVAVGHADAAMEPIAETLEHAVGETAAVDEVIRYRVGPSVGAHTGPGMVECFMFPSTGT
jgi:fatty acid-binding protein DegV